MALGTGKSVDILIIVLTPVAVHLWVVPDRFGEVWGYDCE